VKPSKCLSLRCRPRFAYRWQSGDLESTTLAVGGMFGMSDDTPVLTGWRVSHNSEIHEDTLDEPCHPESRDSPTIHANTTSRGWDS
jgi:hypothetical protein